MSTPMANYSEIENVYLPNLKPFRHGSMKGEWVDLSTGRYYSVQSYATVILEVEPSGLVTYFNDRSYSKITTRQQNIIRRVFMKDPRNVNWFSEV